MSATYEWIFFDYGGTLTVYDDPTEVPGIPADTDGQALTDWFAAMDYKIAATASELQQVFQRAVDADEGEANQVDWAWNETFYVHRMRRIYEQLRIPPPHTDQEMSAAWHFCFWQIFKRTGKRACEGVIGTLTELGKRGYRLGVLSNNNGYVADTLAYNQTLSFFEIVLDSAREGREKPDPEIFRIAARRAGVPCERIFYVGDSYPCDVIGATNAGMGVAWLGGDERPLPARAVKIDRFAELLEHLPG